MAKWDEGTIKMQNGFQLHFDVLPTSKIINDLKKWKFEKYNFEVEFRHKGTIKPHKSFKLFFLK